MTNLLSTKKRAKSLNVKKILLTLAVSSALAFGVSCGAESGVHLFGFDLKKGVIYFGKKETPLETVSLDNPKLENEYLAISVSDWRIVQDKLATCQTIRE